MMSMKNLQNNIQEAILNHKDLIMDLGDNVLLNLKWNDKEQIYEDEMGTTSMKLLLQISDNKVYIKDKLVKLYVKEV